MTSVTSMSSDQAFDHTIGLGLIWIFSGMDKSATTLLSENELEIITQYTQSGRGLLIGVGQQGDSAEGLVDINKLAKVFGVTFSGSVENSDELQVSKFVNIFDNIGEIMGNYFNSKIIKVLDNWREG